MAKIIPRELLKYISYDCMTGKLRWVKSPNSTTPAGLDIDCPNKRGYLRLGFKGHKYYAHRVAWFIATGEQPNIIDHINGNTSDNRFANLRNCTRSANNHNQRRHRMGEIPGISWVTKDLRYRVDLPVGDSGTRKRQLYIGSYMSKHEAVSALLAAIKEFG